MFKEGASLLKVGVVMAALALVLVVCAVVANVALRTEPGQAATEVARNALGGTPWNFFGAEGSAAEESSSEGETRRLSSSGGEDSLGNGSSSHSDGTVGQGHEEAGETQRVGAASEAESSSSRSAMSRPPGAPSPSGASSDPELQPQQNQPHPEDQVSAAGQGTAYGAFSEPGSPSQQDQTHPEDQVLPAAEGNNWPKPTPQRNVYLAGHRMGFRGTWSRMLFYNLDELQKGDSVVLRDRSGRTYEYRVSEVLLTEPTDAWVMGQVRGRDMVSLQTCIPLYTFDKRLIVRADRV